jgi:hypothetical protein
MLEQGPEGHKRLFRTIDRLARDRGSLALLGADEEASLLIYPWLRFFILREQALASMAETVVVTAAESPAWFEDLDPNTVRVFLYLVGYALPSMLDDARLAALRDRLRSLLDRPEADLPDALSRNRDAFLELARIWQARPSSEELIRMLGDSRVPVERRLDLLRRARPEELPRIDLQRLFEEGLRAGDEDAIWMIRFSNHGGMDIDALDRAVIDGAASGRVAAWRIPLYLEATDRQSWANALPLVEAGLARGGPSAQVFAESLHRLPERPNSAYVAELLRRFALPDKTCRALRRRFSLD